MVATAQDFRRVRSALRFTQLPLRGEVFFVCSVNGSSASGYGYTADAPAATIDQAINLCTAGQGDTIIVMEGHAESITGAAGIALDVAGVRIIGLGRGRNRPRITFTTAAGASFDISAANCEVQNLALINGIASQTAMMNITAADVRVAGCEFQVSDGSTAAVLGILTTDAADRLIVEDCHFHGTAAVTAAIRIVGTDDTIVRNNIVTGLYAATGAIEQVTTAGNNHLYIGNTVLNLTADGNNKALVLKSDTTALLANNRFAVIDSTSPAPVTAAAGYVVGNYTVGAAGVGAAGVLL